MLFEQCSHDDRKPLGTFFGCSREMRNFNLLEALQRLLNLAMEKVCAVCIVTKSIIQLLVDTIMSAVVEVTQKKREVI